MSDILDGYFPYDLKKAYPEGVPLEPVDCTEETYTSDLSKNNPKFKMLADLQKDGAKPMSKDQFLQQFPNNVVDKGNIVPIREELEKKFKETGKIDVRKLNSNEPIEAPTDVQLNPEKYEASEIVTLRVRTETGKRTIIIKLLKTDKMDMLYDFVTPYAEFSDKPFELRSKFPNRAYAESEGKNLAELGLAPSSALVVHTK